jgi:anaerobic magnesium-protoporphyrin IX monomethyl ester cyclase
VPRVALVFPYVRTRTATELLFPPLGIATLAAQLRRLGIDTRVFDCTFGSFARLRRDLVAYGPDIVGISSMVSLTANALRVATMVRSELPAALLVAGGPLPTVFPRRYMSHVDAVFRGEADLSFPRFCRDVFARRLGRGGLGALPLDSYPGLFIDDGRLVVDNPSVHHSQTELAGFPFADRSDFDHAAYQREWRRATGKASASLLVTLGCPYGCDFCSKPIFGDLVRRRPLDVVFAEIRELQRLGYDSLWIADDTFTLDVDYLTEFCRRVAPTGMTWSCLSRANGIRDGVAAMMSDAGCTRVYLGLESGDDETLRLMRKRVTVAEGEAAAELYRDAGIEVAAFFIVGYPGETRDSIERTFELALRLPLDEISFNVPMPLPGSRLFERLGQPDEGKDWTHENEVTFVYPSDVDEAWLRRRVDETMQAFAARRRAPRRVTSSA